MINKGLMEILKCPKCGGEEIINNQPHKLLCSSCAKEYTVTQDGIIQMMVPHALPKPAIYDDPDYKKWQEINPDVVSGEVEKGNLLFYTIYHSAHLYISNWQDAQTNVKWIVDIGCGQGIHYHYFDSIENVIGVDMNLITLQKLKKKYPQALLIQADILNLPFVDGRISAVISVYTFEHIYYLDNALLEIKRILHSEGKFYMGLPCEGGLFWNLGRRLTTARIISKKYNIDHQKVMRIEHCNTAKKVVNTLKKHFNIDKKKLFPFNFIPTVLFNIRIALQLSQKQAD